MAAAHDVQHKINAEVDAEPDAVVEACRRATETLGKHARMHFNAAKVTVEILPGLSQTFSHISPVVAVHLRPAGIGRIQVAAQVEGYMTRQSKVMGFIPAGPKRLVGRGYFFRFLNALGTELAALDPATGPAQRPRV
jgi:hypothetical protein